MYPRCLEVRVKSNRWIWIIVEKILALLNRLTDKREMLINYSVVSLNPPKQKISSKCNREGVGIVIQGPILFPSFLDKAINFYSNVYPKVPIILSTWKGDQNLNSMKMLQKVSLIENEKPLSSGIANINLQVTSTISGIDRAIDLGCEEILKIRSDQGLFSSSFLDQFEYSLSSAPESGNSRIATTDFNSFLYRINSPSDQIQFATARTLLDYWSSYKYDAQIQGSFPEEMLLVSYLAKSGKKRPNTLAESLIIYRDYFVFLDSTDLGLVWRKGSWRHPDSRFEQLDRTSQLQFVTPSEWRRMQTDLESILIEARNVGIANV